MIINKIITLDKGIERLSLVKEPATYDNINVCSWEYCGIDIDRKTIKSKVMIPLQKIYRSNPERYYYFPIDVVKDLAHTILSNNVSISLNHEPNSNPNLHIVEVSVDNDTGICYVVISIQDETVWEDILNGVYKGLSLEGTSIEQLVADIPDDNILALEVLQGLESELARELMLDFNNN